MNAKRNRFDDPIEASNGEFLKIHYPLTANPNKAPAWWFGFSKRKFDLLPQNGRLLLFCDANSPHEKILDLPVKYLRTQILTQIRPDSTGIYKFHVDKTTYKINWGCGIKKDGKRFLNGLFPGSPHGELAPQKPPRKEKEIGLLKGRVAILEKKVDRILAFKGF